MNSLGIYEKALPKNLNWHDRLNLVKELGFNFLEFSVDESDERLERLNWSKEQRAEVRNAIWDTGVRIHTIMLSGHRRFPLGSYDKETREHSIEMLYKAVDLAVDLGVRNIQMAGYDVYYDKKSMTSREYFMEGLAKCVAYAASHEVMLDIETMDDPFLNSIEKVDHIKNEIHSPWLQAYPDLGNITAWPENDVGSDLEDNIDSIAAIHLKDTLPVTKDFSGKFKDVPFGEGTVDFKGCLSELKRLNYDGAYTIEMWSENSDDPIVQVKKAKKFFDDIFAEIGIEQEAI
ncbi:L-ribulose-5-phosphate 3-epimerase [Companilactobacillus suantsaicola]|uniref:L-ribulose-5-phosphate 3-epimerase n=1 Tax=Companilactobacillus suantsaicola TaxID=2487723 RepID=A0A4Z0JM23_9LACO|nr:L-ribulose-5-phosphate 3-epimerase [Companilactobacillus suantsaicola]TGD23180.1 L-ribulose-5-phosphate 3-epimerase [Companilactobacillus suantsaicola]